MKTHTPSFKETRRHILASSFLSLQLTLTTLLVSLNAGKTIVIEKSKELRASN